MSLPLRVMSHLVRPRIQHLILHVTDRCNLRCKHCFVPLTEKHTLTPQTAASIAREMGDLLWLDIGGGEPFLLDALPDLVAPFDCEVLGIPTNGHSPETIVRKTREILKASSAKDVMISVSIEGFREEHDYIRVNPRNYDLAFESLKALRKLAKEDKRLRVKCNTVITNENIGRLVEFMRFMANTELLDFHSVILLRGDPLRPEIQLPYVEKLRGLRRDIFKILDGYFRRGGFWRRSFLRRYYRYLWDVSLGNLEQGTQVVPCAGGQAHLVIWATGDVASCELLPAVGNIHREPLAQILHGQPLREQIASIRRKECSCTHNCAMLDSILFNPKNYPGLLIAQ